MRADFQWDDFNAGGGAYTIGKLVVHTTGDFFGSDGGSVPDRFVIEITTSGFVLESKIWHIQNVFYTWGVAKEIDEILFRERNLRLPERAFQVLSGEHFAISDKRTYEILCKQHEGKQNPDNQRAKPE